MRLDVLVLQESGINAGANCVGKRFGGPKEAKVRTNHRSEAPQVSLSPKLTVPKVEYSVQVLYRAP